MTAAGLGPLITVAVIRWARVGVARWRWTWAMRGAARGSAISCASASWYTKRNTVERCFSKLKQFRAVATPYDKRERIYQGTIDVAWISIWLRDPVP